MLLSNVVLSSSTLTLNNCSTQATLAVGASISCLGTYKVQQPDMEAGKVTITASGSSPTLPQSAQVVASAPWEVAVDANPQLDVDILGAECTQSNTSELQSDPMACCAFAAALANNKETIACACLRTGFHYTTSQADPSSNSTNFRRQQYTSTLTGLHTVALLLAAKLVSCPVVVTNRGNLELRDITLVGDSTTVVNNCAKTLLAPGDPYSCSVTRQACCCGTQLMLFARQLLWMLGMPLLLDLA
jgi:hypothetical protein